MLEKCLDGLKLPWRGTTFANWPYSKPMPWALKAQYEMSIGNCTELVVLCKLDPSTLWWKVITEMPVGASDDFFTLEALAGAFVLDRWDFDDRIQFDEHEASIAWRMRQRDEAIAKREAEIAATGKSDTKVPPLKTSNNFASVILHHRRETEPMLDLADLATLWHKG